VADALLLFVFSSKLLAAPKFLRIRNLVVVTIACLTFVLGMLPQTVLSKALFLLFAFVVLGAVTWFSLLSQQERNFAHGLSGNLPWPSSN
jgi:hypothetical protein